MDSGSETAVARNPPDCVRLTWKGWLVLICSSAIANTLTASARAEEGIADDEPPVALERFRWIPVFDVEGTPETPAYLAIRALVS